MTPRLMTKPEAAAYCGLTVSGFNGWLAKRLVPGPLPGTRRWDRTAIDAALDRMSGAKPESDEPKALPSSLDEWRKRRHERRNRRG